MLLIVGPVVAITATLALGLFSMARDAELQARQEERGRLLAGGAATLLQDYIVRMNTSQITPILRSIASTPPVTCASLSLTGLPQTFGSPAADCQDDRHAGELVGMAVRQGDRTIGTLHLRLSNEGGDGGLDTLPLKETGLLIAVMLAAASALALALRYVVTEPIRRMAAAMRVLSGGSVTFDNPDRTRRDELGDVARALDVFRETKITADRTTRELREAQEELIEQAKFASLGSMVAGVAHEVNTPLGVCVTAISTAADGVREIQRALDDGALTQAKLRDHLDRSLRTAELTMANLDRAAKLVRSFRAVAADQATEAPRRFHLQSYLEDVVAALGPEIKKKRAAVEIVCPADLEIVTQPSALWQIVSNLIMNSLTHAFVERQAGAIRLIVVQEGEPAQVSLTYEDDGVGMAPDVLRSIFEPFFTTRRAEGGTGLGMTIVYNLVTQTLGGRIRCMSEPGDGARFLINFPAVKP